MDKAEYYIYKHPRERLFRYTVLRGREWPYGDIVGVAFSAKSARRMADKDMKGPERILVNHYWQGLWDH